MNTNQNKYPFISLMILLISIQCVSAGKNIFIAQTAYGNDSGNDSANAHSIAWFNDSSNWGSGNASIGAGDTLHLCGTLTSALKLLGSGIQEKPIILRFEYNARLSKPHWNQNDSNSNAAITGKNLSFINIDGGKNGIIECTDNGTNKTYQKECSGMALAGCSNIIVKNLLIQNIYVRVAGNSGSFGNGIIFKAPSQNLTIQNNKLNDAGTPLNIQFSNGNKNMFIFGNSSINAGDGNVVLRSSNSGSTLTNVQIYNNSFSKGNGAWSGNPDIHTNCIHIFSIHTDSRIDSLKIYNNSVTGAWGSNSASYIALEGNIYSPKIFNNLFIAGDSGSGGGNGYLFIKNSPGGASIENNTFIGNTSGIGLMVGGKGAAIGNNLFFNVNAPVMCPNDTTGIASCDYNIYYKAAMFSFGNYTQMSYSQWKTKTIFDKNSSINQPILDDTYAPLVSDTVAYHKGINLTPLFNSDKNGILRPTDGPWTIGAFEKSPLPTEISNFIPQNIKIRKKDEPQNMSYKLSRQYNNIEVFDIIGRKTNMFSSDKILLFRQSKMAKENCFLK